MRLDVDISALWAAANKMGGDQVDFDLNLACDEYEPIDIELRKGLDVSIDDIQPESGLLTYHGRQILLYIPDHGWRVRDVINSVALGNRFHVSDCAALKRMRTQNRYDRYIATNDLSGQFKIFGTDQFAKQVDGIADLRVCKFCLSFLNYEGYRGVKKEGKQRVWSKFEIGDFFKKFSSFFKYYPSGFKPENGSYTDDWEDLSRELRKSKNYTCESCGVFLNDHKKLLQVHHINGVKSYNRKENLKVLCKLCHSEEAMHGHLFVSHGDRKLITRLRRKQNIIPQGAWSDAFLYCDPALHGVLSVCQGRGGVKPPEIGYDLQRADHAVVASLELAWPAKKIGVAIDPNDIQAAKDLGWRVWQMVEVMNDENSFYLSLW